MTQASFRPNRSCCDQVLSLTTSIEEGYQKRRKPEIAFVDLTTAFYTVWKESILFKPLQVILSLTTTKIINNMLSDGKLQVILKTKASKLPNCKMIYHKAQFYPHCFNLYLSDLQETISQKFCYTDDIAISTSDIKFENIEQALTTDLAATTNYFKKWRLSQNTNKTEVSCFHLCKNQHYEFQGSNFTNQCSSTVALSGCTVSH